jgi:hypothetical protein
MQRTERQHNLIDAAEHVCTCRGNVTELVQLSMHDNVVRIAGK